MLPVYFSPLAAKKLEWLCEYLEEEWGQNSKKKFLLRLAEIGSIIGTFPNGYPELRDFPGFRKCIVSKYTSLIFRVNESDVEVVTLIDNRQDPDKILQELKDLFP